jgi:transcriptional regulator with XRE-family HTH domain
MTPDRLDECRRILGWTNAELARRLDVREGSIRAWLSGRREIPPNLAHWIEERTRRALEGPQIPDGWKRDAEE